MQIDERSLLSRTAADALPLLLVGAVACGFVLDAAPSRAVQLALLVAAVAAAGAVTAPSRRGIAIGCAVAYLVSEARMGRLDWGTAWWQAILATLVAAAILAADGPEDAPGAVVAAAPLPEARRRTSLEYELDRARRGNHELAVVLLRVDGAHPTGDADPAAAWMLDAVGDTLRATDIPLLDEAHELALVLPETGALDARVAAERIRLGFAAEPHDFDGVPVELTLSLGIAAFPRDGSTADELVDAAARALEHARTAGGNRTTLHSVPAGAPARWGLEPAPVAPRYGF